jgi:hypothetical protein
VLGVLRLLLPLPQVRVREKTVAKVAGGG